MKPVIATILLFTIVFVSQAGACLTQPQKDHDLYQVFNHLFYEADTLQSNWDLPLSQNWNSGWVAAGDTLRVDVVYRDAFMWQTLGYSDGYTDYTLVGRKDLKNHNYMIPETDMALGAALTFTVPDNFTWEHTFGFGRGAGLRRWWVGADQFRVFTIDDDALLDTFNAQYNTGYSAALDDVWLIAFESFNPRRGDYNDLVAIVSRPHELNPVPVPGAALLLFSGLAAAVVPRLRRRAV